VPLPRPLGVAEYRKQMKCRTFCDFIEERTEFLRCVSLFFCFFLVRGVVFLLLLLLLFGVPIRVVTGSVIECYRVLLGFDGMEFGKGPLPSFTGFM